VASGLAAIALIVGGLTVGVPALAHAEGEADYTQTACQRYASAAPKGRAWQVDRLRYDDLHAIATGKGVTVAVIDTGAAVGATPELKRISLQVANFAGTDKQNNGMVDCLHGSFVMSLLAAGKDPDTGFSGIAPDVHVLAIRSLQESEGKEDPGPTIQAFQAAIDAGVDIISISQQSAVDDPSYRAVVKKAVDAGILVVAAAGNSGPAGPSYPAAYPGVMAVGMTDESDVANPNSQYDPNPPSGVSRMPISVAAPGGAVLGMLPQCFPTDKDCPPDTGPAYFSSTGTSFATPIVAGAAALVMERFPSLTAAQVKQLLENTADTPANGPGDRQLGHGIINPYRALVGPRPVPAPSSTPSGGGVDRVPPLEQVTNTAQRDTALAVAGASLGVVGVAGVVAAALPSGRRRRWRPAGRRD